jgi:hypothetical protein
VSFEATFAKTFPEEPNFWNETRQQEIKGKHIQTAEAEAEGWAYSI